MRDKTRIITSWCRGLLTGQTFKISQTIAGQEVTIGSLGPYQKAVEGGGFFAFIGRDNNAISGDMFDVCVEAWDAYEVLRPEMGDVGEDDTGEFDIPPMLFVTPDTIVTLAVPGHDRSESAFELARAKLGAEKVVELVGFVGAEQNVEESLTVKALEQGLDVVSWCVNAARADAGLSTCMQQMARPWKTELLVVDGAHQARLNNRHALEDKILAAVSYCIKFAAWKGIPTLVMTFEVPEDSLDRVHRSLRRLRSVTRLEVKF